MVAAQLIQFLGDSSQYGSLLFHRCDPSGMLCILLGAAHFCSRNCAMICRCKLLSLPNIVTP